MPLPNRRRADALEKAIERYDRLLAAGSHPEDARADALSRLGTADGRLFALAVGFDQVRRTELPEPVGMDAFEARLRSAEIVRRPQRARRPALGFGSLAAAAMVAVLAVLLVPASRSLPGDPLYALKSASEDTRIFLASGAGEARLRMSLAERRYGEVERLIERAQAEDLAPGRPAALGATDIDDPELAALISSVLEEAKLHIESAAAILIAEPSATDDLDELVAISQRGQNIAEVVAEELPTLTKPPVLDTAVTLAKIEQQAKAARMMTAPAATPGPCATPTPTPTPTATPATTEPAAEPEPATEEEPEVTPTPTPTATPEATPEPTPCISPTPTATPTPTPTARPTSSAPTAEPAPTTQPSEPSNGTDAQRGQTEAAGGDEGASTGYGAADDATGA